MAKMLSQIATIIRGSMGGITYTANRGGSIIARARVCPVNTKTDPRDQIKGNFRSVIAAWEDATEETRDGWDQYAQSITKNGPISTRAYSGREAYVATMVYMKNLYSKGVIGTDPVDTPPTSFGQVPISIKGYTTLTAPGTGFTVIGKNEADVAVNVVIATTGPVPATRHTFKGPWLPETFGAANVDAGNPISIPVNGLVLDDWCFVKIRAVPADAPFSLSGEFLFRAQAKTTA